MPSLKRPPLAIVISLLLFLLSTGGFYGAFMLLSDISGQKLGTPLSMLEPLPLDSFLLPGIFLLIFMGCIPMLCFLGMLRKGVFSGLQNVSLLRAYTWAYSYTVFTGVCLICWTLGELIMWGVNPLSVIYMVWGALILLLALVPGVRRYYHI